MKKLAVFLRNAWCVSPSYIIMIILQSVATAAKMFLNIWLFKLLVDELTGARDIKTLLLFATLLVANEVGVTWLRKFLTRLSEAKAVYFKNAMLARLSEKIMNLEYSYLEDPYYLDLKEKAVFAINNQGAIENLIGALTKMITQLITVIGLLAILFTVGWVMIVAFVVSLGLSLLSLAYMSGSLVKIQKKIIPINRKMTYYIELMSEKRFQKDIRLYDMSKMISDRSLQFTNETMDEFGHMLKTQGRAYGGMEASATFLSAFSYAYIGIRTVSDRLGKRISLGSLTMYVTSVINLSAACTALGEAVSSLLMLLSFLDPYLEFMELKDETISENGVKFEGPVETVEFRNVTFTYPKAEKPVLRNISFEVHKGEKISIVGLNGAGKSTLVKLICRMYKADSGEILVNGRNIYDYEHLSYMKEISAVFQDFKLFNFSIEENVSCMPEGADINEVNRLIDEVGLRDKIDELPEGISSRFGKEYDEKGVEFSGGQGQKVAIARALYKKASMVILDEPASALDPVAEAEIYEKFNGLVADKTAIYISHRMSSSVFCDKILIIDGGTVADFDTHDNLMKKKDSLYYKLFMAQAENYVL